MTRLLALGVALAITLVAFPYVIRWLRTVGAGQVVRGEGPSSHLVKAGTPTAGGVLLITAAVVAWAVAGRSVNDWPVVISLVGGGGLGLLDDWSKLHRGTRGMPARLKFPLQLALALALMVCIRLTEPAVMRQQTPLLNLGWWWWPVGVLALTGCANAVNLTDGSDGLVAGLMILALLPVALLWWYRPGSLIAAALIGACAGYLYFNRYPARVLMGDTGSLALGYALATVVLQDRAVLLLPLLGLVFVLETLSVMMQVASFKLWGRRVFRMTPIHHTFHLAGWTENRLALSFWAVGVVGALATTLVSWQVGGLAR